MIRSLFRPAALLVLLTPGLSLAQPTLPNQGASDPVIPQRPATTPAGGDTVGYWQQRADYSIVATLDEARGATRARGTLHYVNHSPDTLRELWLHQHLNAFRPASRWSETDARENRTRFQGLPEPEYGYERFTQAPSIAGRALAYAYPLAPDSTVVQLTLPRPLAPGDSLDVELAWEARPATVPRRQGRRGRDFDFAQWYPRVAVYDRTGWRPNALVPAGEFYGEYGSFDVTLVLPEDQVVGATGVPVAGDPGWARVSANGDVPVMRRDAYGELPPAAPASAVVVPAGFRSVRFLARNVHHFAWSVSPGFVYEGGAYVRPVAGDRYAFPLWDTVAVHVLYRGDAEAFCDAQATTTDSTRRAAQLRACLVAARDGWRNGVALQYGIEALRWLESVFGPYAYPQMTILRRLDGGGTEFPMMMQNGSSNLPLILHEGGHIYAHGLLGNNEWQSGWLDEGFTSYQTDWASGGVRAVVSARLQEMNLRDPRAPEDRVLAARLQRFDRAAAARAADLAAGRLQPIGTRADAFRSFSTYNDAVYSRASEMYEALHDVLGDADFRAFTRDYYARWATKHVDRWAMQGSAERVSGRSLDWFFAQWVDSVGTIDYALRLPKIERVGARWRTTLTLLRVGRYRHPMPVGVRTASGWTVVRGDPLRDEQEIVIETDERPDAAWLDPFAATECVTSGLYRLSLERVRVR